MKKVQNTIEELGRPLKIKSLVILTTVTTNDIRLAVPTAYPVIPDFQCLLGIGVKDGSCKDCVVLVPDELDGYYVIGNVHIFKEAIQSGTAKLPAVIVNVYTEYIPAIRRVLNREALPLKEHYQTMFKLIDFYGRVGPGFPVRKDDGSQEALYKFLSTLLDVDEDSILSATGVHWRERDDLKELLYKGEIGIHEAFDEAVALENEEYEDDDDDYDDEDEDEDESVLI